MKNLYTLIAIFFLLCCPTRLPAHGTLILAVHPYVSFQQVIKKFTPLADYLSQSTGYPVVVRVGSDYEEHINTIGQDKVDIAYLGPASYVTLVEKYGPKLLLARQSTNGSPTFTGKIIVRKTSSLTSLVDLKNHSFAFGNPVSTMSNQVPLSMLIEAGVGLDDLDRYEFLCSHQNVARGVLAGDFDAGAVKKEVYEKFAGQGLRVLATTPPISEHLFVVRSTMNTDLLKKLQDALYTLPKAVNGKEIMRAIKPGLTDFVPVHDSDYDNLRTILQRLER